MARCCCWAAKEKKMIAGDPKTAGPIDTQRPRGIVGADVDVESHLVVGPCRSRGPAWTWDPPVLSSGTHIATWTRWDPPVLSGGTTVAVERNLCYFVTNRFIRHCLPMFSSGMIHL